MAIEDFGFRNVNAAKANAERLPRLPSEVVEGAHIAPDRRTEKRDEHARRRHERAVVNATGSLSVSLKNKIEGRIFNLSEQGCCMQVASATFAVGDAVWFGIDSLQPWRGTVRWVRGDEVGVEFDRPFYPAVFDLIVEMNKPVTAARSI